MRFNQFLTVFVKTFLECFVFEIFLLLKLSCFQKILQLLNKRVCSYIAMKIEKLYTKKFAMKNDEISEALYAILKSNGAQQVRLHVLSKTQTRLTTS